MKKRHIPKPGGNFTHLRYMSTWDKNTPEYRLWRLSVYKRDGFKCKKCGLKMNRGRNLQAHHIYKWSDFPQLRYNVNNGITLCWECHKCMLTYENAYIKLCQILLSSPENYIKAQNLIRENKEIQDEPKPTSE